MILPTCKTSRINGRIMLYGFKVDEDWLVDYGATWRCLWYASHHVQHTSFAQCALYSTETDRDKLSQIQDSSAWEYTCPTYSGRIPTNRSNDCQMLGLSLLRSALASPLHLVSNQVKHRWTIWSRFWVGKNRSGGLMIVIHNVVMQLLYTHT